MLRMWSHMFCFHSSAERESVLRSGQTVVPQRTDRGRNRQLYYPLPARSARPADIQQGMHTHRETETENNSELSEIRCRISPA